jgi:hypothetical protein
MKQIKTTGSMILFMLLSLMSCINTSNLTSISANKNKYAIGDTGPSGIGKVFYITDEGLHGLEAAPNSWNVGSSDPTTQWKISNTETKGTSVAIGTGYANTYTYMAGKEYPAAELCRAYSGGGKKDWFLPSKDELNQMYLQKKIIGDFAANLYWTSTQFNSVNTWCQYFVDGIQYTSDKNESGYCVRPIRSF